MKRKGGRKGKGVFRCFFFFFFFVFETVNLVFVFFGERKRLFGKGKERRKEKEKTFLSKREKKTKNKMGDKKLEMISEKESQIRKGVGSFFLLLSSLLYLSLGPLYLSPWAWFVLVGVGMGTFRSGVEKE